MGNVGQMKDAQGKKPDQKPLFNASQLQGKPTASKIQAPMATPAPLSRTNPPPAPQSQETSAPRIEIAPPKPVVQPNLPKTLPPPSINKPMVMSQPSESAPAQPSAESQEEPSLEQQNENLKNLLRALLAVRRSKNLGSTNLPG